MPFISDRVDVLRRVPAFAGYSDAELAGLVEVADESEVRPGELLTREGLVAPQTFLIVSGTASVTIKGRLVGQLGPGAYIGVTIAPPAHPGLTTVTAQSDMCVLVFGPRAFDTVIRRQVATSGPGRRRNPDGAQGSRCNFP